MATALADVEALLAEPDLGDTASEAGAAIARADIVAFLRGLAREYDHNAPIYNPRTLADMIERGDDQEGP